jgi:hypothetical protein
MERVTERGFYVRSENCANRRLASSCPSAQNNSGRIFMKFNTLVFL